MPSFDQRAKELFLEALSRPTADRGHFLADACGGDTALKLEVESLLTFHESGSAGLGPAPGDRAADTFSPGDVFAGRYRMVTLLGRGGMGDVWRADDLVLEIPVALKLIRSASPEARARILNEVRLARQITHPAVCRVFDVGETDDQVFFSMEFVRGEDLAALLRRVGRLPSEKVFDIGRQLCGGLATAHAQGVLHRDLKPANVLIDDNGLVRITDFGIAVTKAATADHTPGGTPGYMAPEQSRGAPLSEQTDLYALGLVLYELVAGQHHRPRPGSAEQPPRPSAVVSDVDPRLESVILQAIALDPRDRPPSAVAMAAALQPGARLDTSESAVSSPRRRAWSWVVAAAGVAVIVALGVAIPFFSSRGASALTEQDTLVLADFMNTTGEMVFDGALKVALAVSLEQSPFLKVFPDEQIRETLQLMKRSPEEPVTRALAREIAQRQQLKALIAGSIGSLGQNYVIALEAINAQTGDVMAREQVEATSKEQVLTTLGAATSRLREKLGESLASIQKFDVELPRATTPSLDALHAYALALEEGRTTVRREAIPHLQRAIELDPDFALALALLSGVYANTGQTALAPQLSRRAFELRDRVSERERFFISWRYYRDALQAWEKGLELARTWTASYPREPTAFNSLGLASMFLGRYDAGAIAFREAIRLDPKFSTPYGNLAQALTAGGLFKEAREAVRQAQAMKIDSVGLRQVSYSLASIEGDTATMARDLEVASAMPEPLGAYDWTAHSSSFAGQIRLAHDQFREAMQKTPVDRFPEWAARFATHDAESHAVVGQCTEARAEVASGLEYSRDTAALEFASRLLAFCGAGREGAAIAAELGRQFPEATLIHHVSLPVVVAAAALQSGDAKRAIELLEPVKPYDRALTSRFWPSYLRGLAYLQLKQAPEAEAQFRSITDRRGEAPSSSLYPLAHLARGRAQAMAGDRSAARASYDAFFALWKNADQDLQPMKEARQEYSRIR